MSFPERLKTLARVLVVENDLPTCQLYQQILAEIPVVDIVHSAPEALEKARSRSYDLAIVDINLSGKTSGITLMHQLRALNGGHKLPITAVTAYARPSNRNDLLAEGFDGYVSKPFSKQQLLQRLTDVLQRAR